MSTTTPWLTLRATPLAGLNVIERSVREDTRGFFGRVFCAEEFAALGLHEHATRIAQINHSHTRRRGSVRGMHFQRPPHAEAKVVSCLRGEVFDVAVDLRRGSPTFLQWHGEVLSAANHRSLAVPCGFAHGFQALTDECELVYLHSHRYVPSADGGVSPGDAALAIAWPLPVAELSARDAGHAPITSSFNGLNTDPPSDPAS